MLNRLVNLIFVPLALLAIVSSTSANYPLPDDLQTISIDNAAQIQQLSALGSDLQGHLAWAPDNQHLAVGTSSGIQVYDSQNLDSPVTQIDAGMNFVFNEAGEIESDGQRWDSQTGDLLGDVTVSDNASDIDVEIDETDLGYFITLTKPDGSSVTLNINPEYEFSKLVPSPDGQFALIILRVANIPGEFNIVQLWHIAEGRLIGDLRHSLELFSIARFFADGNLIVTRSYTNAVYGNIFEEIFVWDGRSGQLLSSPSERASLPLEFSPDDSLFAYFTWDGIALWSDHRLGTLTYSKAQFGFYGDGLFSPLVISPDNSRIATAYSPEIVLWDISPEQITQAEPSLVIPAQARIYDLVYSPEGTYLVSIEENGIAEVWDAQTGSPKAQIVASSNLSNATAQFSANGQILYVRDNAGNAHILDIVSNTTSMIELPPSASINADWTQAAYWDGGIVRIVSLETGDVSELEIIPDYFGSIIGFSSYSGLAVFSGSSIQAYDLYSADIIFEQALGENQYARLQFSDDGSEFLLSRITRNSSTGQDNTVEIWESDNLASPRITFGDQYPGSGLLQFSSQNHYISEIWGACGDGGGGPAVLWDTNTAEQASYFHLGDCGPYDHAFSPDGQWQIVVWDTVLHVNNIEEVIAMESMPGTQGVLSTGIFYRDLSYRLRQVEVSPDGALLAVGFIGIPFYESPEAPDPKIDLYRLTDVLESDNHLAEELVAASIPNATQAIFSPDSQWLLTDNGFWDAETGEQISGVAGTVATFNPDGTILATYDSGVIRLWDVSALISGDEDALATFNVNDVQELAFNPDGNLLFIKRAGEIQIWGIR